MKVFYRRQSFKLISAVALLVTETVSGPLFAQEAPAAPAEEKPASGIKSQTAPSQLPPLPKPLPVRPVLIQKSQIRPVRDPGQVIIGPVVPGAPPVIPAVAPPTPPPTVQPVQTTIVPNTAPTIVPNTILAWDAEKKEYHAKATEANAHFTFNLTNVSSSVVMINSVRTSCGCTAAKLPETPWRIEPGNGGPIEVDMNIAGKRGVIPKSVTVDTSAGMKYLTVESHIAEPVIATGTNTGGMADRGRNQMLAQADPMAIFKGDCAKCHVEPTVGKMGKELYASACSICHNAEHRAAMVPDLQDKYRAPMPADFWKLFITLGKPGSLMPSFAKSKGGILSEEQIASLVDYLVKDFPKEPKMVYHDPHGPSGPAPVVSPVFPAKSITNSPSASLPKANGLPANVSVFPASKAE